MKLYRPVGLVELALIFDADMRAFPPRLPEQPIFYPVLNQQYAAQIARDWNATSAPEFAGYVTEFEVDAEYARKFPPKTVGASVHEELWVPAEELPQFNSQIVGRILLNAGFFGSNFTGFVPSQFGLRRKNAHDQFMCLTSTFGYNGMDFVCELAANKKTVFLNFPYWVRKDFSASGVSEERKAKVLGAIKQLWSERFAEMPLCSS